MNAEPSRASNSVPPSTLVAPIVLLAGGLASTWAGGLWLGHDLARAWGPGVPAVAGCATGVAAAGLGLLLLRRWQAAQAQTLERARTEEAKLRQLNRDLSEWAASGVREVRDLSERVIDTQEQERGRIARDLHDSVGQALTALHYEIELIAEHPNELPDRIGRALRACEEALVELRQRVYDLRPPELGHTADVNGVLRSYAERYELRTRLPISFRSEGPNVSSEEIATCLLRVLQEALTNVTRHAEAGEVGVALVTNLHTVAMEVVDDGRGFSLNGGRRGSGLRGIEERCAFLGGSVELESTPGQGTRLRVQLPLMGRTGDDRRGPQDGVAGGGPPGRS